MSGQTARLWPARYELLDGLRGLACLGVLLHHLGVTTLGHYAVMIFFVISGYCITASAQSCIRRGVPITGFMLRRVRRIYPPYLLAIVFFVATRLAKMVWTDAAVWQPTASDWIQNLTLTQWLSVPFHPLTWPSDNPKLFVAAFWSLNYEEQFYLVTGLGLLLAQRFRIGLNRTVLVLFIVGVAWNLAWPGGWITGIFIEYWAHFALGSAVYFLLCEDRTARARSWFYAVTCLVTVYCVSRLLTSQESSEVMQRVFIELPLLSLFAVGLVFLRPISAGISSSIFWKPIGALGTISYSLYLVHQFNLTFVDMSVRWFLPSAAGDVMTTLAKIVFHVGIGAAFWYVCERPFVTRRINAKDDVELPKPQRLADLRSPAQ